jgi:hypothetical protein
MPVLCSDTAFSAGEDRARAIRLTVGPAQDLRHVAAKLTRGSENESAPGPAEADPSAA